MINEYLYENKANMYAVVVPSGTIKVKKYVALENGKYDLVGTKVNKKINEPNKRYQAKIIYGFNPLNGQAEKIETFTGRNAIRDAIRCLIRHHKLILKIN